MRTQQHHQPFEFFLTLEYEHAKSNRIRPETGLPEDEDAARNAIFKDALSSEDLAVLTDTRGYLSQCGKQ